jgi:hypothetical protein
MKNTLVHVVIIVVLLCASTVWAEGPVAVSPGSTEVAVVNNPCPTFSWAEVTGAASYTVEVYEMVTGEVVPRKEMVQMSVPVLRKEIQAPALSWTPSLRECLEDGGKYVWYVGAKGEGQEVIGERQGAIGDGQEEEVIWSEGRVFEVSVALTEAEQKQVKKTIEEYLRTEWRATESYKQVKEEIKREVTEKANTSRQDNISIMGYEGSTNTLYGSGAGNSISSGGAGPPDYNTFIGSGAGYNTTSGSNSGDGDNNTFVGYMAGYFNTTGYYNTFIGRRTGFYNDTGYFNTFVGAAAGLDNTTGRYNTFIGVNAGSSNGSADFNTFLGFQAGFNNCKNGQTDTTDCESNTFIGANAGFSNTTGNANIYLGTFAGYNNTTGSGNIFIGYRAGYNETGSNKLYIDNSGTSSPLIYGEFDNDFVRINGRLEAKNSATDESTGNVTKLAVQNTSGTDVFSVDSEGDVTANSFTGDGSGLTNVTASSIDWANIQNRPAGLDDGDDDTTYTAGTGLTLTGTTFSVNFSGTGTANTVARSDHNHDATYVNEGQADSITSAMITDGTITSADVDTTEIQRRVTGTCPSGQSIREINQDGTVICEADDTGGTEGTSNTLFGEGAGNSLGDDNDSATFIGYQAGYNTVDGTGLEGHLNTFVGYKSGYNNTTGQSNAFFGYLAGYSNFTGDNNTFIGPMAGYSSDNGSNNVFMGYWAGYYNTTGASNVFIGYKAGFSNSTDHQTGNANTFVGNEAGYSNTSGYSNTFLGNFAGHSNTTGNTNTFLGTRAGYNNVSGSGNIFIGFQAGYYETGSNRLYIDNTATEFPLIYGEFDTDYLRVNGFLEVSDGFKLPTGASNGYVLTSDADGNASWQPLPAETGDISSVTAGTGLTGGGTSGDVTLSVNFGGSGTANTVARSDHNHDSTYVNEGQADSITSAMITDGTITSADVDTTSIQRRVTGSCPAGQSIRQVNEDGTVVCEVDDTNGEEGDAQTNTYFGTSAGANFDGTATSNTLFGYNAGMNLTGGDNNTVIGYAAGYNNTTGTGNVFIGYKAGYNETGSNKLYIENSDSSSPLIYGEFDNDKVQINGKLGVGALPTYYLHVTGNVYTTAKYYTQGVVPGFWLDETDGEKGAYFVLDGGVLQMQRRAGGFGAFEASPFKVYISAPTNAFFLRGNGYLGLGVDPSYPIHSSTGAYLSAGGVWTNASSREYKEDIRPLGEQEAMEALKGLEPVRFRYKAEPEEEHVGFIAEEVPELVATRDRKGLSAMDIVAVLTKVVQKQQKEIQALKAKVNTLEAENQALRTELLHRIDDFERQMKLIHTVASR